MAEIFEQLNEAFSSDSMIDELGIIMSSEPPSVVLMDHKLGIAMYSLKPLLKYSLQNFYEVTAKLHDRDAIDAEAATSLLCLSRAILCIRGNFPLGFSIRKRLISQGRFLSVTEELQFLKMLFTKHPKCPSSWDHRRWCLSFRGPSFEESEELQLCTSMAEAYPKNYYAWMHRLWLLERMNVTCLEAELSFTKLWLLSHVSDHCAVNHRTQVAMKLIQLGLADLQSDPDASVASACSEVGVTQSSAASAGYAAVGRLVRSLFLDCEVLIESRPGSEALWYLRRDAASIVLSLLFPSFDQRWVATCISSSFALSASSNGLGGDYEATNKPLEAEELSLETPTSSSPSEQQQSASGERDVFDVVCAINALFTRHLSLPVSEVRQQPTRWRYSWLGTWLKSECKFVRTIIDNPSAWNSAQQHSFSVRYLSFLLFQTIRALELLESESWRDALLTACRRGLSVASAMAQERDGKTRCWSYLQQMSDMT